MTPYDLIIAILDSEGGNEQSTIELVNQLASELLDENVFKCCLIILVLSVTFQLLFKILCKITNSSHHLP